MIGSVPGRHERFSNKISRVLRLFRISSVIGKFMMLDESIRGIQGCWGETVVALLLDRKIPLGGREGRGGKTGVLGRV